MGKMSLVVRLKTNEKYLTTNSSRSGFQPRAVSRQDGAPTDDPCTVRGRVGRNNYKKEEA